MAEVTDAQLLEQLRKGDPRATEQLLARHEQSIYRFGLRMCGNEDDARDVLQETLLAAFKNLDAFRGDAQLSTWLYQVARSFCIKQRRRHEGEPARHESIEGAEVGAIAIDTAAPDARAHATEVGHVIEAALNSLQPEQREAIVLRDVEGLSAEQAAEVVGVSIAALKSRLHRARLELKQRMSAVLDDDHETGMGCPELQHELAAYASSEIDQAACVQIEAHLQKCPRCAAACDSLKRTVSLCRAIPGGAIPASVRAAVRRALQRMPA